MLVKLDDNSLFVAYSFPEGLNEGRYVDLVSATVIVAEYDDSYLFPDRRIEDECPEMMILAEALEDVTGYKVRYEVDMDILEGGEISLSPYADELVLTVSREQDGIEYIRAITTPFGCFGILFYAEYDSEHYLEVENVVFTEEMRDVMFLSPCETWLYEEEHCVVEYVAGNAKMNFPPGRPENYLFGSVQYEEAKRYWEKFESEEVEDVWMELFDENGDLRERGEDEEFLEDLELVLPNGKVIYPEVDDSGLVAYDFDDVGDFLLLMEQRMLEGVISEEEYVQLVASYSEPEYLNFVIRV